MAELVAGCSAAGEKLAAEVPIEELARVTPERFELQ
jgi:hypothetical protein